jgi:hypothetical protein
MTPIPMKSPRQPPPEALGAAPWFCWTMDQFNLFDHAPRPERGPPDDINGGIPPWCVTFKKWLATGAGDLRKRTVGQMLLRCWNDCLKVPGAGDFMDAYLAMDHHNQRGVRTMLEHLRSY